MNAPANDHTGAGTMPGDDQVLAFRTLKSRTQGRVVRLGATADAILSAHDYPEPVTRVLGEALALTALLGALVRTDGRLILQTKTDGPLHQLVVHFTSPGDMRALARFDKDRLETLIAEGRLGQGHLLGTGHLAMTIDPGGSEPRTQGIVTLANHDLAQAAHTYFRQSEQIPTFVRLAVARHQVRSGNGAAPAWRWRAGGLILQRLPDDVGDGESESGPVAEAERDDDHLVGDLEEDWQRARMLASTVEDHELLDPTLPAERLLLRLFAEEGVRAAAPLPVRAHCGCTRERVENLLKGFGAEELADMREESGSVTVTCDYCKAKYRFAADEVEQF
ncbi:MAG: Hsp33 family molecular chaperone [Hyphomicrobiaceae bacterium]